MSVRREFERLLTGRFARWLGVRPDDALRDRLAQLDQWGRVECLENAEAIIGWLREAHRRQGQSGPFPVRTAHRLVQESVRNAGDRNGEPVLRAFAEHDSAVTQPVRFGPIRTRHLIYHVCPLEWNDDWRDNVRQLLRRMDVFNGRRTIAIVQGWHMVDAETVKREFDGHDCEFLVLPNDPQMRERATFLPLLLSIQSTDPHEATFYGHTKGVSRRERGVNPWRNAMYHNLLDRWQDCMDELKQHSCVGCFKMDYSSEDDLPYSTKLRRGLWLFAGTFFWFRNDAVFRRSDWRDIPMDRYGVEAYLGGLFASEEAKSIYQPFRANNLPLGSLYRPDFHAEEKAHPEITTRNLLYHILPVKDNDVWLRNVHQILKRIDLFNGKKVIGISYEDGMTVEPDDVKRQFEGRDCEFIVVDNDRVLRETITFPDMLRAVESTDPREASFYAHAKGVITSGNTLGVMYWRNAMYHHLLDRWDEVAEALRYHPVVGTHRKHHPRKNSYPDGVTESDWHFAGTYFWFRNKEVFELDAISELQYTGYGLESFPATIFDYSESFCMAFDNVKNPYNPNTYSEPIEDEGFGAPSESDTGLLKVELGGGRNPEEGYVNVDSIDAPEVDHKVDLNHPDLRLPFDDDSVGKVLSRHCFEHLDAFQSVFRELMRVCIQGAHVEITVPHWMSPMAMCHGHRGTISEKQVEHWTDTHVDYWFGHLPKRLKWWNTEYIPSDRFGEAKDLHDGWTDAQIYKFVPGACHEVRFHFHVVLNESHSPREERAVGLKIGLDLDGTLYHNETRSRFFKEMIESMAARGHRFYCTSGHTRKEWDERDRDRLRELNIDPDLIDPCFLLPDGGQNKAELADQMDVIFDDDGENIGRHTRTPIFIPRRTE